MILPFFHVIELYDFLQMSQTRQTVFTSGIILPDIIQEALFIL